ncbi:MAG TPA: diaminopimelate epimerase [Rhodospirillales bacterium]|jgi:diaminopimelate epimerase|nr:diaminopimelate epimerase [Rhodospirillales bacterium]
MATLLFTKMHGLGNDFVVLDGRRVALPVGAGQARAIADRHTGVGCDQVIIIEPTTSGEADVFMRVRNADGGEAEACGNAARCVAAMIMTENAATQVVIETAAGLLDAEAVGGGDIAVDMGQARLDWRDIPLAGPADTLHLGLEAGPFKDPVAVGMGNPHAVFFFDDAEAAALETFGPAIERHEMFPHFVNVGAAQVLSGHEIRLRVWERGAGITRACGSGACAALVAAHRRGYTGRSAQVILDGGSLGIEWLADDHVLMTGPVAVSFRGTLDESLLS